MTSASDIVKQIEEVMKSIPEDPLVEMMREKGFDPDKGDFIAVSPEMYTHDWGPFGRPYYIRISNLVPRGQALFVKNPLRIEP